MRSNYEMKISKNHTIPIDGFKEYGTNSNLLVIGSSGSGKTMNVVLPMLLDDFNEEHVTFVVQDCKGTLYKNLSKKFINEGYNVKVLDFTNPKKSNCFNPFAYVDTFDDARNVIKALGLKNVESTKDRFWETASLDLLSSLLMYIKREFSPNLLNISFLSKILGYFSQDYDTVRYCKDHDLLVELKINNNFKVIKNNKDEYKDKRPTIFYNKLKRINESLNIDYMINLATYYSYPENTFGSIIAVAKGILAPYVGEGIKNIISRNDDMKLKELANTKTIIFVNPSDVTRIYDPAVSMFYTLCLQNVIKTADDSTQGRLNYPFRFIIDDFASGTKIEDFDKAISNIRSRNISCTLIVQSKSQLETLYSRTEALTLMSNCSSHLYLGSNDFEQEQDISKRLNMSYNQLHELDRKKLVIISENQKPIIDAKYDFKEHPNYELSGFSDIKNYINFYDVQNYIKNQRKTNNDCEVQAHDKH